MVTLQSKVTIGPEVLFRDLGGESVVLNLATGKYYGFDAVATRMWTLLAEHGRVEDACNQLLAEYDVEEGRLREDLLNFVHELVSEQLVYVVVG
jgi:hypothetical protein